MKQRTFVALVLAVLCAVLWSFPEPRNAGAQTIGGVSNFFLQSGTGAVSRTFNAKMRDVVNAKDFGVICDGSTDDTTKLQTAINYVTQSLAGGVIDMPAGSCKISSTINLCTSATTTTGCAILRGYGNGSNSQPTQSPGTALVWYGGASTMLAIGNQTTVVKVGGGLQSIKIDGRALANVGVLVKDSTRSHIDELFITGTLQDGILLQNSTGLGSPTGHFNWGQVYIDLRGGTTDNANGMRFAGSNSGGSDGVTLGIIADLRINHANGSGIVITKIGDNFHIGRYQAFRDAAETGFAVWADSTDATQIIGGWTFNSITTSSALRFDKANTVKGWVINQLNDVDIATGVTTLIYGEGSSDVHVVSAYNDAKRAGSKKLDYNVVKTENDMQFQLYDAANSLIHTTNGTLRTGGVGTPAVTDAGQSGGAIRLATSAAANDVSFIVAGGLFTSGISRDYYPELVATVAWLDAANFKFRLCLCNDTGDAPTNGVFIVADPADSANIKFKTRSGGTETSTTIAALGSAGGGKIQFKIVVLSSGWAAVYYRAVGNDLWGLGAVHTTNIPSALLQPVYYIKTTTTVSKGVDIYEHKFAHNTEM